MNAAKRMARHWWSRRHYFTREQLNSENWPHPRPARDPRIIVTYLCLVIPSIIQVSTGPAPTSVQSRNDFDLGAVVAFAAIATVGSALIIYAAFCRQQYWSFITELCGCLAIVMTFVIYLAGTMAVPDNWSTNTTWWSVGMVIGHLIRAAVIGRRFW